jgi:hypothetical protein
MVEMNCRNRFRCKLCRKVPWTHASYEASVTDTSSMQQSVKPVGLEKGNHLGNCTIVACHRDCARRRGQCAQTLLKALTAADDAAAPRREHNG